MGSMIKMTDYVGLDARARETSAISQIAVRNRVQAGTPVVSTGELRLQTPVDDAFTPFPGTGVPGGPSA